MEEETKLLECLNRMEIGSATMKMYNPLRCQKKSLNTIRRPQYKQISNLDLLRNRIRYKILNSAGYQKFVNERRCKRLYIAIDNRIIRCTLSEINANKESRPKKDDRTDIEIYFQERNSSITICAQVQIRSKPVVKAKKSLSIPDLSSISLNESPNTSLEENVNVETADVESPLTNSEKRASWAPETDTDVNDLTVGELSSYFETILHIPKKMSEMAEMMYT